MVYRDMKGCVLLFLLRKALVVRYLVVSEVLRCMSVGKAVSLSCIVYLSVKHFGMYGSARLVMLILISTPL